MYQFKIEKRDEYLQGRTITYLANIVGITREYMTSVLTGNRTCSKMVAYCIVKAGNYENEVENYFNVIKKGE